MLAMMAQGIFLIFILCICISQGNSFAFPRSSNRRPRTRLFGTSSGLSAAPARYSMEPKRPSVRPFRIPGFERSYSSLTRSRASRLGFDLGLGGRALSDPIASMYDSAGGLGGSRLSYVNGVGDLGGFDTLGGGGDLYGGSFGLNDGLITAANSRDLKMMDINSAGSRLRQPIDIGNYGNQMVSSSSSGLGGSGVSSNQGQLRNFDLSYDGSGISGGGSQYLISGGGNRQQGGLGLNQASLDQQSGQLITGGGVSSLSNGGGQLGLGSNTWIGLESSDYSSNNGGGLGFSSNQIGGLGGSNQPDLSLNSGVNQYGMSSFSNGQLNSGLDSNQVDLGLSSLGTNQVGLGTSQMSTLDLSTNQLGQQGFLNQGAGSGNLLAPVGSNGNTFNSQLGQSQMVMSDGNQLSSMAVQNNLGGTSLSNQVSSNGFGNGLGIVGSSLSGDSLSAAALPTQGTLTGGGQYLSSNDGQVINIGLGSESRSQYQASGALSNSPPAPPASPMPTVAGPSSEQYSSSSGSSFETLNSEQGNYGQLSEQDGTMNQFAATSNTRLEQLSTGTDAGQMASSGSNFGQYSVGGVMTGNQFASGQGNNMVGQFATDGSNLNQMATGNSLGQLHSQDQNQNLVAEKMSGVGFASSANSMGQFSLGGGGAAQLTGGGSSGTQVSQSGHFISGVGDEQFAQGTQGAGQFSQGISSTNQFSQGVAGQLSQGQIGSGQLAQDTGKSGQFVSGGEGLGQYLLDSGQVGGIQGASSLNSISGGLGSQSVSQNGFLSQQFSATGRSNAGNNVESTSMLQR